LTVNADYISVRYKEKLQRFWELYWVELSSVESKEVESAMVKFRNTLKELQDTTLKIYAHIKMNLKLKDMMLHKQ
jgi:hypothetical protein